MQIKKRIVGIICLIVLGFILWAKAAERNQYPCQPGGGNWPCCISDPDATSCP